MPVSLFLSAGRVSACLASLLGPAAASTRAITLGVDSFRGGPLDEVPLAAETARACGLAHEVRWVGQADMLAARDQLLAAMDQPSTDGVNVFFIARVAAAAGHRVALSGLGADELFGGYPGFVDVPRLAALPRMPGLGRVLRRVAQPLLPRRLSPKWAGLLEYGGSYPGAYLLRRALGPGDHHRRRLGLGAARPAGDLGFAQQRAGPGGGAVDHAGPAAQAPLGHALGGDPAIDRDDEAGLAPRRDGGRQAWIAGHEIVLARRRGAGQQRRQVAVERGIGEGRADLQPVRHAGPVGVAQQLGVESGVGRLDLAVQPVEGGHDGGVGQLALRRRQAVGERARLLLGCAQAAAHRALARLVHPNIVAVHDAGVHRGELYIVMELVTGRSLREWLERHPTLVGELSYRYDVTSDGGMTDAWRELFVRHPGRFLLGSDTWINDRWSRYGEIVAIYRSWLAQLPRDVAEAIAHGNGERLFPPR